MKKLLFTFILFGMGMSFVNAQSANYKDFEWDVIKLGYVLPGGDNLGAGGMGGMEFRLNVRDDLSIGLRTETAAFDYEVDGDDFDVDATWSWAATADYYFNTTSCTCRRRCRRYARGARRCRCWRRTDRRRRSRCHRRGR